MSLPIKGLIHVTGEHDVGKTLFALSCGVSPNEIALLDSDLKGNATFQQLRDAGLELGLYKNMVTETKGKREIDIFDTYMKVIDSIPENKMKVLIFDTFSEFENTFKPKVSKDPKKYREFYSPMGTIKGAEEWAASFDLEAEVLGGLLQKFQLVFIVTHLKAYYVGSKRVEGKSVANCKEPVIKNSFMRLWLRRNPNSPVPIGLVLKRPHKLKLDSGRLVPINVLPLKLTPQEGDTSTWDVIERYWNNPVGNRPLLPYEMPDAYELSILDGTLTEDQKLALKIAMDDAEVEKNESAATVVAMQAASTGLFHAAESVKVKEEAPELTEVVKARITELYKAGTTLAPAIKRKLVEEGVTVEIGQILAVIKE
jgi:hypothetical protein